MNAFTWLTQPWGFTLLMVLATSACVAQKLPLMGQKEQFFSPQGERAATSLAGSSASSAATLQLTTSRLPLSFEANQGQTDERVDFLARGRGYTVFLTATEAVLALRNAARGLMKDEVTPSASSSSPGTVLRMQFVGANRNPHVTGGEELPGKVNYFRGKDPQQWRTNIPTFATVTYQDVYPGVDLVYYGNQRQLEYDLVLAPGTDPAVIRLAFAGLAGTPPRIDMNGNLILGVAGGEVRLLTPHISQEIDGVKHVIPGRYVLRRSESADSGVKEVGFEVAAYDSSKPLIIDPVLSYSTYLGGSGEDVGRSVAVDSSGNAYVTGPTCSLDFPTSQPFQGTPHGGCDVFVIKMNPTGTALIYSTYLGGSDFDYSHDLTIDASGNVYVTGTTRSTDFPTHNPLQATSAGCSGTLVSDGGCDGFIIKIDPIGSALVYSTYLGGSSTDAGRSIALESVREVLELEGEVMI